MAEKYKHLYEQTKKMLTQYQDELIPGFRKQIEELEAKSKWIPVTERLPGICESVLVCFDFMGGKAVKVSDRYGKNGLLWSGIPSDGKVTHWMPLPEPPKEVE